MKEHEIRPQDLFEEYLRLAEQDAARLLEDRGLFSAVPCPACDSKRTSGGFEKLGFEYQVCADCRTLYLSPRPGREQLEAYYREGEAVRFWATDFFKKTAEARRGAMFRPRALLVGELISSGRHPANVVVDVGCGYGIFLEEIAALGSIDEIVGIEPAPELAAICREKGFRVIEAPVENVGTNELQADFAAAFEVLEHVFDAAKFLSAMRGLVHPGGTLLLTTLSASGFDIQLLWKNSKSVFPPHHINLLSVEGMRRLFERCDVELIELSTPGELDVDIVANAMREDRELQLPAFAEAIVTHPDESVRSSFQSFLQRQHMSSHIRVVARRPQ